MNKNSAANIAEKAAFADWLHDQLAVHRWCPSDLAAHAGVSLPTISQLLQSKHAPDPDTCRKLAQALSLPVDVVCEKAGFLPLGSCTLSTPKRELIHLVKSMPDSDALKLLASLPDTHGDPGGWEVVDVMADPDCELQKVRAHAPRVSLVVPLILLADLLVFSGCLWSVLSIFGLPKR